MHELTVSFFRCRTGKGAQSAEEICSRQGGPRRVPSHDRGGRATAAGGVHLYHGPAETGWMGGEEEEGAGGFQQSG